MTLAVEKRKKAKEVFGLEKFVKEGIVKKVVETESVRIAVPVGFIYDRERNLERPSFNANRDWRFGEWLERAAKVWREATELEFERRTLETAVEEALRKSRFVRTIIEALKKENLEKLVKVEHSYQQLENGWKEYAVFSMPFAGLYLDYGSRGKRKAIIFLPTEQEENIGYAIYKLPPFNLEGGLFGFIGMEAYPTTKELLIVEG